MRITADMYHKDLLNGAYWFLTYSTYFAILSLVFFILEGPDLPRLREDVLEDVYEGKGALEGMSKSRMLAERCTRINVRRSTPVLSNADDAVSLQPPPRKGQNTSRRF